MSNGKINQAYAKAKKLYAKLFGKRYIDLTSKAKFQWF